MLVVENELAITVKSGTELAEEVKRERLRLKKEIEEWGKSKENLDKVKQLLYKSTNVNVCIGYSEPTDVKFDSLELFLVSYLTNIFIGDVDFDDIIYQSYEGKNEIICYNNFLLEDMQKLTGVLNAMGYKKFKLYVSDVPGKIESPRNRHFVYNCDVLIMISRKL